MRISYIELKNYRRFRDLKLQLPDGIVGILGLNGSGKTTIIESVAWALFGNVEDVVRTSREGIRWSGARPADKCSVTLEFELAGTEYKVTREMSGKSLTMRAALTTKDMVLATGDRPVKEKVEQLLGMDYRSFFTSVFAKQKELNALQGVSAGERKKTVLRMIRIDAIDTVLENVRRSKRDAEQRIKGATQFLFDEEGREREKAIRERIPSLEAAHAEAEKLLRSSEEQENAAQVAVEEARKRRDELRKDFDAYNQLAKDLTAKKSTVAEQLNRADRVASRLREAKAKLERLPELETEERKWTEITRRKEALEAERSKSERAKHLSEDIRVLEHDEKDRVAELTRMHKERTDSKQVSAEIERLEREKAECEMKKAEISGRIGELGANRAEKLESAEKDKRKLSEIMAAGKEGVCPTCERRLEDAFELLVKKLQKSSEEAERSAEELEKLIMELDAQQQGLLNKIEGIGRKRRRLDEELAKASREEAAIGAAYKELIAVREKLTAKRRERAEVGEIIFSPEEYAKVKVEYERLRSAHDEYVRAMESEGLVKNLSRELQEVKEAIERSRLEEASLQEIINKLEPKKNLYDLAIRQLDEKSALLNRAKDELRKAAGMRDRARIELNALEKDLEHIAKIKKDIESDRRTVDDLALLEDVVTSFKDSLIARVAPMLSDLTSKNLESMTEGRYSRVQLDDSYGMQIEDQGAPYPVSRFSGGEADLANLSLRLAISGVIAERTGAAPINFLILDEIFGSLDPTKKRSVMAALSRLSAQFRQVFLITHIEDIKDSVNYVIKVEEQEDGTSKAWLAP
ncbi:MAG: AAA family ATPase [Thermoplasmata archaeon]